MPSWYFSAMASLSRFARARAAWDACMTWGDCIISARTETQPGAQFARQEKQLTGWFT